MIKRSILFISLMILLSLITIPFVSCAKKDIQINDDKDMSTSHTHTYENWKIVIPAACDKDGQEKAECPCGQTSTRVIKATGHSWNGFFTVDKEPTYSSEGEKSEHCKNCTETRNKQFIPKLEQSEYITYTVTLKRPNGVLYPREFTAEFYGTDGQLKYEKQPFRWGEPISENLLAGSYEIKIKNLIDGWQLPQEKFVVTPENPNLEIIVTASLQTGPVPSGTVYDTASVIHNLEFYDFRKNNKITIQELLQKHKLILLTFYKTSCPYSQKQMPQLLEAYKNYSNDVAVILIEAAYSSYQAIEYFISDYNLPDNFYYISDSNMHEGNLYFSQLFKVKNYPTNIYIDCDGVEVCYIVGLQAAYSIKNFFKEFIYTQSKNNTLYGNDLNNADAYKNMLLRYIYKNENYDIAQ